MRIFSFIFSLMAFGATVFFLITDFPSLQSFEGVIYFSILVVLSLICLTGVVINRPEVSRRRYSTR